MSTRQVRTQAELDQAIKDRVDVIELRGDGYFEVGSASVSAFGSASVRAFGSASVRAFGSASVRASGSASVRAFGSASVRAFGSASVSAFDSASVSATACVPVQDHGPATKITGGVIIPIRKPETMGDWCSYYGVTVARGWATVFKGVDADLKSAYAFEYPIGTEVACTDWAPIEACGRGLHFSPHPFMTEAYCTPVRYLEVKVKVSECVVLGDKIKAPRCKVVREVTADGDEVVS